ncbi:type II toxin-antitoxin system HicB family antitoxin [Mesorhizobium sp. B1-1-8]|uniref:type II toxin-antitoxin system HicB family antitoxin n=1 Tax=Mesorhizobium sp. B1-1-8 TaxID=2589976 RepID=UPI001D0190A1|nr:type II toxin-antitoxin system HicB family antitoxin [Mesorhizobium sp. B1-1-8]UCI07583.1 type II toxin-antitoxin system HicB family antitoxin [Mesorhizobium sp. B1-1-8]
MPLVTKTLDPNNSRLTLNRNSQLKVCWTMSRYIALVDAADGFVGVSFPDAPGCVAQSKDRDEAIKDAVAALAEWVDEEVAEGRQIPAPRSIEVLVNDAEVREALAGGAILAQVPLIRDAGRPARANISLDAGLLADVDETAHRLGVTRSAFVAAALRDKIRETV